MTFDELVDVVDERLGGEVLDAVADGLGREQKVGDVPFAEDERVEEAVVAVEVASGGTDASQLDASTRAQGVANSLCNCELAPELIDVIRAQFAV